MKRFRDFYNKKYKNPFFTKQKKTNLKLIVLMVFLAAVIAGLIYFFIYSSVFKINKIEVSGNRKIAAQEISELVRNGISGWNGIFPKDNLFFLDDDQVKNMLMNSGLAIRSVDVKTSFKKLKVAVGEYEAVIRVVGEGESYILDQDGRVMKIADFGEGENLIAISLADKERRFSVGNIVLAGTQMEIINELHKYFATHVGVRDRIMEIDELNATINVVTDEGWYAIFDPDVSLDDQFKTLSLAISNKFTPEERKNILYIDARFGDRVFYKNRE